MLKNHLKYLENGKIGKMDEITLNPLLELCRIYECGLGWYELKHPRDDKIELIKYEDECICIYKDGTTSLRQKVDGLSAYQFGHDVFYKNRGYLNYWRVFRKLENRRKK